MRTTQVYIASTHKDDIAAWAATMTCGGQTASVSGCCGKCTANRAALFAVKSALSALRGQHRVTIYTDMQYVSNGINEWMKVWRQSGFGGIKNSDVWSFIDMVASTHEVESVWMRDLAGNKEGFMVKRLAASAIKRRTNSGANVVG